MRYFFEIAYNGKDFCGWQRQPNVVTVQETIELSISRIYGNQPIEIVGCGRTDAGVHASQFFFHVDLPNHPILLDLEHLRFKLNRMLPSSISIFRIFPCEQHARFDALYRTYRYFVTLEKDPFRIHSHLYLSEAPHFRRMNEAAKHFLGTQDFTSLAKLHSDVKTNSCTVTKAFWEQETETTWYFEISADRFLRNMVRSTVGTLLEVGLGKIESKEIRIILDAKDRSAAAKSVAAHGLYLCDVKYHFDNY
jgi:tRNA pseudouridine38-40 synthase